MKLSEYITAHGITATAEPALDNPNMTHPDPHAQHWLVTLAGPAGAMAVPFTQGSAATEEPSAADVLDCIASDSTLQDEYEDAIEMAVSLGETIEDMDDVESARRTYEAITKNRAELRRILGSDEAMETLLYEVDRG